MPRLATVGSLWHYEQMYQEGVMSNYHLLLAHQVLDDRRGWKDFYDEYRAKCGDPFIVMDNSLVELGYALDARFLIEAQRIVEADTIVLPDVFEDMEETVLASVRASHLLHEYEVDVPLMLVTQGSSQRELFLCVRNAQDQGIRRLGFLSVPRVVQYTLGSRSSVTASLWGMFQLPIHMLGFSGDLLDDISTAYKVKGVMGIDSSRPITDGLRGINYAEVGFPRNDRGSRPEEYLDPATSKLRGWPPECTQNIRYVQQALRDGVKNL